MGDLPGDASVSSSPKNPEVTLTIGFLNEKVKHSCVTYGSKWVGNSFFWELWIVHRGTQIKT